MANEDSLGEFSNISYGMFGAHKVKSEHCFAIIIIY